MRAHHNPTRMRQIALLARRLARRLHARCPACTTPGWGRIDVRRGLPCEACGTPTDWIAAEIHGCPRCQHREHRPRPDALRSVDPARCPRCNP
jgi:hypothetical protein